MIIPIPDNLEDVKDIINVGKNLIRGLEALSKADKNIREQGFDSIINNVP